MLCYMDEQWFFLCITLCLWSYIYRIHLGNKKVKTSSPIIEFCQAYIWPCCCTSNNHYSIKAIKTACTHLFFLFLGCSISCILNTRPPGQIWPTRPCHMALEPRAFFFLPLTDRFALQLMALTDPCKHSQRRHMPTNELPAWRGKVANVARLVRWC